MVCTATGMTAQVTTSSKTEVRQGGGQFGIDSERKKKPCSLSIAKPSLHNCQQSIANLSQLPAIRDDIHCNIWNTKGAERKERQTVVHVVTADVWPLPRARASEDKLPGCRINHCSNKETLEAKEKQVLQGTGIFCL